MWHHVASCGIVGQHYVVAQLQPHFLSPFHSLNKGVSNQDVEHILSIHKHDQAIMISERSNKTIMTKVTHPQRTKIVQPLGMYPI